MDRMGRTGGGGPRYIMPVFEDGSTPGPGDLFYDNVARTYAVDEWNAMPDAERAAVYDAFLSDVERAIGDRRITISSTGVNQSRLGPDPAQRVFSAIDDYTNPLRGLFGSGPAPSQPIRAMPNMPNTLTSGEGPTPMMIKDWLRRG